MLLMDTIPCVHNQEEIPGRKQPETKNYMGSRKYHYVDEQAIFMLYFTSKGLSLTLNSIWVLAHVFTHRNMICIF